MNLKKTINALCIICLPFACAAGNERADAQGSANPSPEGFWGALTSTPAVANSTDAKSLATQLALPENRVAMQPQAPSLSNEQTMPVDWLAAIQLAVSQHPTLASSIATLEAAEFGVSAARGGYLPALTAGITSGRQQNQSSNGQIATLGLSQMLYDFGKTGSAVDAATARQVRQQAAVLGQIDALIQQTALSLNEVYRYQQLVNNARRQLASVKDILQLTQLRADAGASTRVDPVQARARVEAAQAELLGLETQLQQQQYHLQSLTGQPVAVASLQAPPVLLPQIRALGAEVDISTHPTMLMAKADAAVAQAELRGYKAQRYPTLSLEASTNKYVGDIARDQQRSQYQNVYLSLNSTLYQGGALKAQENASAKALQASRALLATTQRELVWQQRNYFHSISGLEKNIQVLEKRMETISETRSLYREQYLSLGNRNALDLLNAEQEIGRARQELTHAQRDLWSSAVNYLAQAGMARQVFNFNAMAVQGLRNTP